MDNAVLIRREKENAEAWKREIETAQEQAKQVRALCRAMRYSGEGLDEDDREAMADLIDERTWEVESKIERLVLFFSDIDRVGLKTITLKVG